MVSSKPAEEQDNGVCGLPPMQYNYIVVTKFYYQCLAQVCSSGVGTVCIDATFSATYMCVIWHHGWLELRQPSIDVRKHLQILVKRSWVLLFSHIVICSVSG